MCTPKLHSLQRSRSHNVLELAVRESSVRQNFECAHWADVTSEIKCGCLERNHWKNQSFGYLIRLNMILEYNVGWKEIFGGNCVTLENFTVDIEQYIIIGIYNCMHMQMCLKQKKSYLVKSLPSKYQL